MCLASDQNRELWQRYQGWGRPLNPGKWQGRKAKSWTGRISKIQPGGSSLRWSLRQSTPYRGTQGKRKRRQLLGSPAPEGRRRKRGARDQQHCTRWGRPAVERPGPQGSSALSQPAATVSREGSLTPYQNLQAATSCPLIPPENREASMQCPVEAPHSAHVFLL